jgi:hypothetical protein
MRRAFIATITLLMLSCSVKEEDVTYYNVIDSIEIEEPAMLFPMGLFQENRILAVDIYSKDVIMLSLEDGKIISRYDQTGRGPGELIDPCSLDFIENSIWVGDRKNNKIIKIQYDEVENLFTFIKEFRIDGNLFSKTIVNNEYILASVWGDVNNIYLYDFDGNLLSKDNLAERNEDDITTITDMMENAILLASYNDFIISTNIISKEIFIYKIEEDYDFKLLNRIQIDSFSKGYVIDETNEYVGLLPKFVFDDMFYVSINPKIADNLYYFYSYDYEGNMLGKYRIGHSPFDEVCGIAFSEDGNKLWFMDFITDDKMIYLAIREEVLEVK